MNGYTGTINPLGMYVRALYDYDADDSTSLSFRNGDIIQVLNQLESGWWDGVMSSQRGWFPSNYCELVSETEAQRLDHEFESAETDVAASSEDDYEDAAYRQAVANTHPPQSARGNAAKGGEEEAFWIPQATPDGRLYYFNTLTHVSTLELPLESPSANDDYSQRNRVNGLPSDHSRPPPEMMQGGYERADDTDFDQSASEAEDSSKTRSSKVGSSVITSVDSNADLAPSLARSAGHTCLTAPLPPLL